MKTSTQTDLISLALSKAQREMLPAKKSGFNPHFKSHFSTAKDLLDVIREPFAKNEISLNWGEEKIDGEWCLTTRIEHKGQFYQNTVPLLMVKRDMQGLGSADSYAVRYGIRGIAGIATEDFDEDDGEAAVGRRPGERQEDSKPNLPTRTTFGIPPFSNISIPEIWEKHTDKARDVADGYKEQYDKKEKVPPQAIELMKYGKSKGLWPKKEMSQ